MDDSVCVWHFADNNDSAGANSRIEAIGDVRLGVKLSADESVDSGQYERPGPCV